MSGAAGSNHSVHAMVIILPLGLFSAAAIFDLFGLWQFSPASFSISFYVIGAGILAGAAAAVLGHTEVLAARSETTARTGRTHGLINLTVLLLFAASWLLRRADPGSPGIASLILSFSAVGLTGIGALTGIRLAGLMQKETASRNLLAQPVEPVNTEDYRHDDARSL